MLTLILSAVLGQAEAPQHLAEKVFQTELNKAKREYLSAVQAAGKRMATAMNKAADELEADGKLIEAVNLRKRAKLAPKPDPPSPLAGKYKIVYTDKSEQELIFNGDGTVAFADRPGETQPVRWVFQGEQVAGFAYWPEIAVAHVYEVRGSARIMVMSYPAGSRIVGRATAVR
jgi:hypothetical protein